MFDVQMLHFQPFQNFKPHRGVGRLGQQTRGGQRGRGGFGGRGGRGGRGDRSRPNTHPLTHPRGHVQHKFVHGYLLVRHGAFVTRVQRLALARHQFHSQMQLRLDAAATAAKTAKTAKAATPAPATRLFLLHVAIGKQAFPVFDVHDLGTHVAVQIGRIQHALDLRTGPKLLKGYAVHRRQGQTTHHGLLLGQHGAGQTNADDDAHLFLVVGVKGRQIKPKIPLVVVRRVRLRDGQGHMVQFLVVVFVPINDIGRVDTFPRVQNPLAQPPHFLFLDIAPALRIAAHFQHVVSFLV